MVVDDGVNWNCDAAKSQKLIIVTCPPYNAKGDNATDDRAALSTADNAATAIGTMVLPKGTYRVASNLTLSSSLIFRNGAIVSPDAGVTVTIAASIQAGPYKIFTIGAGTIALPGGAGGLGPLASPTITPAWWGAALDGSTDDTAAVNAAIAAMGTSSNGARLVIDGRIKTGDLTIPPRNTFLVIELSGQWYLSTTLTLPGRVGIIGTTGATPAGQQYQPGARIQLFPNAAVPVIKTDASASPKYLANLNVSNSTDKAIYIQGSFTTLDNVAVTTPGTSANEEGVYIENAQWISLRRCTINVAGGVGKASLHLAATTPSLTSTFGVSLLYVDDLNFAGKGILADTNAAGIGHGGLRFHRLLYENGLNEMFTFDTSAGGVISDVMLDHFSLADYLNGTLPSVIKLIGGSANTTPFRGFVVRPYGLSGNKLFNATTSIAGLTVDRMPENLASETDAGWSLGTSQRTYTMTGSGWYNGPNASAWGAMASSVVPYRSLAVTQDATLWSGLSGTATVTTGITAPDGTATAATLTSSSGVQLRTVYSASQAVAVGDWIIAGVWVLNPNQAGASTSSRVTLSDSGTIIDNEQNANGTAAPLSNAADFSSDAYRQIDAGWTPLVGLLKVTQSSVSPQTLSFDLRVTSGKPKSFWNPFLIYIPASAGFTEQEVIRLKRSIVTVPSNVAAGTIATWPGQTLAAGALAEILPNGQAVTTQALTEVTTIAAAATTTTAIQIPANAVVYGVSVRVTTAIPTCATFTVTAGGKTFDTAAVNCAATSTDPGTAAGPVYFASAAAITITPNLQPVANTGRVRTTIHYYTITPPTS